MVDPILATVVLLATLVVFAVIGFRVRGGHNDVEDYLIARNSQPALTLGLSFLASGMGAWVLFAPPEVGATVGLVGVLGYGLGAAAPIVAFALLGRRLRRLSPLGHGLTEFVRLRFGGAFHHYVVAISIMYMLIFVTAELTAIGGVTAILSGADPRLAILAVAGATLAYTTYGGLRASLRTDRWQAWLLLALLALAAGVLVAGLPAAPPAEVALRDVNATGLSVALTLIIAVTVANLFHQGYWQRVWAARDQRALDRGAVLGIVAIVPVVVVVGMLGVLAAERGVELGSPPLPFFALLQGVAPVVAVAVLVLAVALVASSVDTLENGLAALVASEQPERATLSGARLLTIALMVPAVLVALQGYSVLRLFLIADLLCAATAVPALLGLWSRASRAGALSGAIAGLIGAVIPGWWSTGSLPEGIGLATFPGAIPTLPPFLGALLASSLVAVAVSLITGQRADLSEVGARVPLLGSRTP